MILVVDNTAGQAKPMYLPHLLACITRSGHRYRLVRSIADIQRVPASEVEGVVLSGSPLMVRDDIFFMTNQDLYMTNVYAILQHYHRNVPILGICFGCQLLTVLGGGKLHSLRRSVCRSVPVEFEAASWLRRPIPPADTPGTRMRFCCRYAPYQISAHFRALAHVVLEGRRLPCMIRHRTRPMYGCLFHAEYHPETRWVIDTFLNDCRQRQFRGA